MIVVLAKASKIPPGSRWITIKPHGDEEKGQPILIQDGPDGSARVIGGAGGALNYLKLRHVRSQSEYQKEAAEKKKAKAAEKKEQIKRDKEAGIHESKKKAKADLRLQRLKHESDFVNTVAETMGWDKSKIEFPEEQYANLSEAATNKVRDKFHREVLKQAVDAVDLQRQRLVADADARMTAEIGEVPLKSNDDNVISVEDLNPIPSNTGGLGFSTDYKKRADAAGLKKEEVDEAKAARLAELPETQREGIVKRGKLAAAIADELKGIKEPEKPSDGPKLVDAAKAAELIRAQKKLSKIQKKAKEKVAEIDASPVEPKAYVLEGEPEDATDEKIKEDLSSDLRTVQTRAFLSEFEKLGGDDSLGKFIGIGA